MSQAAENESAQPNSLLPAGTAEQEIVLILPRGYLGTTIGGKWQRLPDGRTLAHFTRWELEFVLQFQRDVVQPVLALYGEEVVVSDSTGETSHD